MARLRFSEEFLESLAGLDSRVEERVWEKLALVESFSDVGSSLVESSLRHAYGSACLKVVAAGYDMLYERGEKGADSEEVVDILGIVSQRAVR
jgi:hypothetical protein